MKNLVLSNTTITAPEGDEKVVNYAQEENKVNYFGEVGEQASEVTPVDPDTIKATDMPEGVSIAVNVDGNIEYKTSDQLTGDEEVAGIAIKDGENAFLMATEVSEMVWLTSLTDISGLPNYTSESTAITDYDSKGNTDKILSEQPTQALAAIYARAYHNNSIPSGSWDLPSAGILNLIVANKSAIDSILSSLNMAAILNKILWTSTERGTNDVWSYYGNSSYWSSSTKLEGSRYVLPVYQVSFEPSASLIDPDNMPSGVSIVDVNGDYVAVDDWTTGDPWTGVAVNTSYFKGILGIADSVTSSVVDDLSISTRKYWSNALYGTDISGLTNCSTEEEAKLDYDSKANTDTIIAALGSTEETNNAAVVARAYSKGCISAGKWDLPAAGIVQKVIVENLDAIIAAVTKLGAPTTIFSSYWVWSSTEHSSYGAWRYSFGNSRWYDYSKDTYYFVVPVYTAYFNAEEIPAGGGVDDPSEIDPPVGVNVVDGSGNVMDASEWTSDMGLTGIAISDGTHKFIMACGEAGDPALTNSLVDDLSISSRKYWSYALYGTDISTMTNYTSESTVITDYDSKGNTDKILTALASSSNPAETNNAAVVCRNYEAGIVPKGSWDLPAAGILNLIVANKSAIVSALTAMGLTNWATIFSSYWVWSSTEHSSSYAWGYSFSSSYWNYNLKDNIYYFAVPVFTIS